MKLIMTLSIILILGLAVNGQDNDKDIELSSKFIIDLIDEVEWPEGSYRDSFVINVVGDNGFVPILQSIARSDSSGGKKIVRRNPY